MRYTVAIAIAALVLTASVSAQEDPAMTKALARVQAVQDSLNSVGAKVSKAFVDSVLASPADSLGAVVAAGVKIVADTKDGMWVQIDVPLASSTGFTKKFWAGWMATAPGLYRAKPGNAVGRLRMHHMAAIKALQELNAVLK